MAAPTRTELAKYVAAAETIDADFLDTCLAEASALVARLAGHTTVDEVEAAGKVPAVILRRAVLETAADQFSRRRARNGIVEFGGDGVTADVVRISRDPAAAARPILAPFLGPAVA